MRKVYFLLLCLLLTAGTAWAQSANKRKKNTQAFNKKNKETEKFLEKQWWLGLKGGINLSKVNVEKVYSIVAPTNYTLAESKKKYDNLKLLGSQFTLEIAFYYKKFTFSIQPTFQHSRFVYSNQYRWIDNTESTNSVQLNYEQEQKVNHMLIPLLVKYEITGDKIRPYVQAGIFQAVRISATKSVTVSGIDNASGGVNSFKNEAITVGATDLFAKNSWGLSAGTGVNYHVGNIRLNLDFQYHLGMSNIVSSKNRYSNDRLAGVGDSLDDLTMNNLSLSIGCLFPLRFLESGFKSLDRK